MAGILSTLVQLVFVFVLGSREEINFGVSLVVGTLVGAPFAYVVAGIVLGEVGVFESIQRSFRLARSRWRLALVVALFGIASQFIVLFGVSIGGDVVVRVVDGTGIADSFPPPLVIPLVAALVFAFGTLLFLVEAITAAPAVFAFEALTHYTHGLEAGPRATRARRQHLEPVDDAGTPRRGRARGPRARDRPRRDRRQRRDRALSRAATAAVAMPSRAAGPTPTSATPRGDEPDRQLHGLGPRDGRRRQVLEHLLELGGALRGRVGAAGHLGHGRQGVLVDPAPEPAATEPEPATVPEPVAAALAGLVADHPLAALRVDLAAVHRPEPDRVHPQPAVGCLRGRLDRVDAGVVRPRRSGRR